MKNVVIIALVVPIVQRGVVYVIVNVIHVVVRLVIVANN